MKDKAIHARVFLDTSARRKVVVIPNRIDLALGPHHIEWTLGDRSELKFTELKIKGKHAKNCKYQLTDHSITLDVVNDFHDDDVDLGYSISLLRGDARYSTEPIDAYDSDDDECADGTAAMIYEPMARSGPIIRTHPV